MKIVELGAGIHRLDNITEPTHLVSTAGWDCILQPKSDRGSAVVAEAPLKMTGGFQIRCGRMGIQAYEHLDAHFLWVHSNWKTGINCVKSVRLHRSLIEFNGTHSHYMHGIYSGQGTAWVSNCIVTRNSGIQHCSLAHFSPFLEIYLFNFGLDDDHRAV